jgi:hypothetical protein
MPASFILLTGFISSHKGKVSGRTIKSWMSGIKAWHDINHAPWAGDDRWVQLARTTANKEGTAFKKKQRSPVTLDHLHALSNSLDTSTPLHAACWAVATASFWGCRRLGETTVPSVVAFDPKFHVQKSVPITFKSSRDQTPFASLHIPWTKSTKELGGTLILTARDDHLCPVKALKNHLQVNGSVPGHASLFAYSSSPSSWSHLLKHSFLGTCHSIWKKKGLDLVLGHSFRIGGSTELLLAGTPPEIVAAVGGWTSLAFLLYWRRIEEILPMNISKAYHKQRILELASTFEDFRIRNNIPKGISIDDS